MMAFLIQRLNEMREEKRREIVRTVGENCLKRFRIVIIELI